MRVRTPEEAIELLRGGEVEELSLDHDLGLDVGSRERTGYDVLLWLLLPLAVLVRFRKGAEPAGLAVASRSTSSGRSSAG